MKSDYIYINGNKLFLDKSDVTAYSINDYSDDPNIKLLEKEIKNGDICIDVGANIGVYTFVLAKLVGENGKVFAFEPDPNSFKLLEKNVQTSNFQNVTIEHKAVGEKNELVKLAIEDYTTKMTNQNSNGYSVECITIDDYFKNYDKEISFVKIDAEGSEVKIIRGMTKFLQKNKSVKILTEYYPKFIHELGTNPEELLIKLLNNGFNLFDIGIKNGVLTPTDLETLSQNYTTKFGTTDLFCKR